jgi:hypothetical protein
MPVNFCEKHPEVYIPDKDGMCWKCMEEVNCKEDSDYGSKEETEHYNKIIKK